MNRENLIELWNVFVLISEGEPISLVQALAALFTVAGIIGSLYTLWWATGKALRAGRAPFGWFGVGEVCREAVKLLLSSDTQTDKKKTGLNGMGGENYETTIKAGLLVVCLEDGSIKLHGTDLGIKLSRRERRRILRTARHVRKRILAHELEQGRKEAAELLARVSEYQTAPQKFSTLNGVPIDPVAKALHEQAHLSGQPIPVHTASDHRRLADDCNLSSNGKPGPCPGCR